MSLLARLRPVHIAALTPWVVAVVAALQPIRDNSFLWHVRAGTAQIDLGMVLTEDPFSFTRLGHPWRTQSWLLELGYGWLDRAVGLAFVPWLVGGVVVLLYTAAGLLIYARGRSPAALAIAGVATAWTSVAFLNPRPALVGFLFLALILLVAFDKRLRWTLPLLVWCWASIHSSFPIAFVVVLLVAVSQRRLKAWRDLLSMGVVVSFTAHGLGVVSFLFNFVASREALGYLTEWATPNFLSAAFLWIVPALLVVTVAGIRGGLRTQDVWLFAGGLLLLVSAARSVFPGWLLILPAVAAALSSLLGDTATGRSSSNRAVSRSESLVRVTILVVVLVVPFVIGSGGGLDESRFPVEAAAVLDGDRVWADDASGGYLIYATWPERLVFVDDRAELYGATHFRDTLRTRAGTPTWREVFETWQIDEALVRVGDELAEALRADGWVERYSGDEFVVLSSG